MGPAADTSSSQGGHSRCSPATTPFASNILIRDAAFDSLPRGARELRERIREYEDRVRRTIAEAYAEQLGETPNDLRPRMLAEGVCGYFEAARTSWPAGPRDVPLHEQMSEALDIADRMTRPLLRRGHPHPR
jgi:hypothetical protein